MKELVEVRPTFPQKNKESEMTTSNSNKVMSLNCVIPCDDFEDIFTLEISDDKITNLLKPMIKKWWPNRFRHIDPSKFILYKASYPNSAISLIQVLKRQKEEGASSYGSTDEEELGLSEEVIKILENNDVAGRAFFNMTKQDFRDINLKAGPALVLADFAKESNEKRLPSPMLSKCLITTLFHSKTGRAIS